MLLKWMKKWILFPLNLPILLGSLSIPSRFPCHPLQSFFHVHYMLVFDPLASRGSTIICDMIILFTPTSYLPRMHLLYQPSTLYDHHPPTYLCPVQSSAREDIKFTQHSNSMIYKRNRIGLRINPIRLIRAVFEN